MSIELIQSTNPSLPLAVVAAAESFVMCTAVPEEQDGQILEESIEVQTRKVFENLEQGLQAAGCTLRDILHVTVYLTDIAERTAMTEVWTHIFAPTFPARATIGVDALAHPSMRIEVTAVAWRQAGSIAGEQPR